MKWKGTKDQLSKDEDFYVAAYNENGDYVADFDNQEYPAEEADAHLDLFIDAVHTIQKCDRLPSELLKENEELIAIQNVLTAGKNDIHSYLIEATDRLKTALAILNDVSIPGNLMETYGNLAMNSAELIKQIENGK